MGNLQVDDGLKEAETIAKEIFLEDSEMSIDTAARLIHDRCRRSLHKDAISRIRAQVRQSIHAALPSLTAVPKVFGASVKNEAPKGDTTYFVNRPRFVDRVRIGAKGEEMKNEAKKGRAVVDTDTKRKYLGDWAMNNPLSTIREARDALRTEFGETLGTSYIAETLKAARGLVVEEQKRKSGSYPAVTPPSLTPQPVLPLSPPGQMGLAPELMSRQSLREVARALAKAMKDAGIKSIRVNPDDTIDFEVISLAITPEH